MLARDIRTNRNHRHMVILASSSLDVSQVDGEELALASGCDAFLSDAAVGGLAEMLDAYLSVEAPIALLGGEVGLPNRARRLMIRLVGQALSRHLMVEPEHVRRAMFVAVVSFISVK